jgi:peptidoglycan LD-endopeptidase CwlK
MKYRVLVYATESWRSRKAKHDRIAKMMMAGGAFESVTFDTVLWKGGKPVVTKDGKIDGDYFETTFSGPAKVKGYNHAIFSFSMAEGRRWGVDSGVRGSNYKDGDYFGESWVRSDENSITRFKDGSKRVRYEKTVPHEIGHELKNQGLTPLLIHDYDYLDTINNIEQFYLKLKLSSELPVLKGRIEDLKKKLPKEVAKPDYNRPVALVPLVQRKADAVVAEMARLGHPVRIVEGFRSFERQAQLYAQGRTTPGAVVTNAKAGESFHNYGVAVDFVFRKEGYNAGDTLWSLLGKVGKLQGFEWGGDWKGFVDRPHFELKLGHTLKDFQNSKVDYKKFI